MREEAAEKARELALLRQEVVELHAQQQAAELQTAQSIAAASMDKFRDDARRSAQGLNLTSRSNFRWY